MMHSIFRVALFSVLFSALFIHCANDPKPQPQPIESQDEKITAAPSIVEEVPTAEAVQVVAETKISNAESDSPKPSKKAPESKPKAKESNQVLAATEKVNTSPPTKKEFIEKAVVEVAPEVKEEVVEKKRPDHSKWDAFLRQYVSSSGAVNYAAIKANSNSLNAYLEHLSANHPASDWSRNEKMSYWINAYNAFTVKKIVDNYPLKSITDLDGGKPWDVKWIKLGAKTYSLNNIENDILRPDFGDARIHFAVNCAAKSCPPLLNRAFTSQNLNSQLASQTKKFVNNASYTTIGESSAEVSKIFEWYAVDFGDLKTFLNKYSTTKLNANATISYKEYDWALNGK